MEVEILNDEIIVDNVSIMIPNILIEALKEYAKKRTAADDFSNISYADLYCFRSFVKITEILTQAQYEAVLNELGFPNGLFEE